MNLMRHDLLNFFFFSFLFLYLSFFFLVSFFLFLLSSFFLLPLPPFILHRFYTLYYYFVAAISLPCSFLIPYSSVLDGALSYSGYS